MITVEPVMTINGQELSIGQAMAVRVAIESFVSQLATGDLGDDLHGRLMQQGYMDRLNEVRLMIYGEAPGLAHQSGEPPCTAGMQHDRMYDKCLNCGMMYEPLPPPSQSGEISMNDNVAIGPSQLSMESIAGRGVEVYYVDGPNGEKVAQFRPKPKLTPPGQSAGDRNG